MVADILFISFVGYDPNNQQPGNLYIKEHYPKLHDNMEVIGLRSGGLETSTVDKRKDPSVPIPHLCSLLHASHLSLLLLRRIEKSI
jgi:hypothetical protein